MLLDDTNTMEDAPNVYDHNSEATTADFAVDVPAKTVQQSHVSTKT